MTKPFKIFVSLPMRGLDDDQVRKRQKAIFDEVAVPGWELMDTMVVDENADPDNPLWYLGRSIQLLGTADAVIFANDWRTANGCIVEHLVAEAYDILSLYESDGVSYANVK